MTSSVDGRDVSTDCSYDDFGTSSNSDRLAMIGADGPTDPNDEALARQVEDLRARILALGAEAPYRFIERVNPLIVAAPPEVKRALFEDGAFVAEHFWHDRPDLLDWLVRKIDPVRTLHLALCHGACCEGWESEEVVEAVRVWATEHPSLGPRALVDAGLLGEIEVRTTSHDLQRCLQALLSGGAIGATPRQRMDLALASWDEASFLAEWNAVIQDPEALKELSQDAAFLDDVADTMSPTTLGMVRAAITRGAELASEVDEERLRPVVDVHLAQLDGIDAWFAADTPVLHTLQSFDRELERLFDPLDPDTKAAQKSTARGLLRDRYETYYGRPLEEVLRSSLHGAIETQALALVDLGPGGDTPVGAEGWEGDVEQAAMRAAGAIRAEMRGLWVAEPAVGRRFDEAQEEMNRLATKHAPADAGLALTLSASGMRRVGEAYDRQFGSLVDDLHQFVQTDEIRNRALTMIGDRVDPTREAAVGALSGQESTVDTLAAVQAAQRDMAAVAEMFDEAIRGRSLRRAYQAAEAFEEKGAGRSPFEPDANAASGLDHLAMLEASFRPLGGSLRHGLAAFGPSAQPVFGTLGLGRVEQVQAVGSDHSLTDDGLAAKLDAEKAAKVLFDGVQRLASGGKRGKTLSSVLDIKLPDYLASKAQFVTTLGYVPPDPYETVNGISLPHHLGLTLRGDDERRQVSEALGTAITAQARTTTREAESAVLDPDGLEFDAFEASSAFTLEEARRRAIAIHDEIDDAKHVQLEATLNGNPEELRVVVAVFQKLYGYDPLFRVREMEASGALSSAEALTTKERLGDSGRMGFGRYLAALARAHDVDGLYDAALKATPAEKDEVLADGAAMAEVSGLVGEAAWDRIYRSLTGQLTLGDAMRSRDSTSVFGWGTDESGMEKDAAALMAILKAELAKVDPATIDEAFRTKCIQAYDDPAFRAVIERELSGGDKLKLEQIVLRGGAQTGTDKAWAEAESIGGASEVLAHVKAMTTAERKARRQDARFLAMLTKQLSGTDLEQAMRVLAADEGTAQADIDEALHGGFTIDEGGVFGAVLAMPRPELIALAADEVRLAEIRARLEPGADERTQFDDLIADARDLGDADLAPTDGAWTEDARAQHRDHLVLKHTYALRAGVTNGRDDALAAAQAVYAEKGTIEASPGTKEDLFGATERGRVFRGVERTLTQHYVFDPDFQEVIEKAIGGTVDPSGYRLAWAFEGWDNGDSAKDTLAKASDQTVLEEWSNVVRPGKDGVSLKQRYDEWQEAMRCVGCTADPVAEQHAVDVARYRFVDFPLDVSRDLVATLTQQGNLVGYTTARDLLAYEQTVRARIVALPSERVAKAIGMDTADYASLPPDSARKQEIDAVNGTDRQARSMHAHIQATARHQMGTDSLADAFTYTDEQMAAYWSRYGGQYGEATQPTEGEAFGTIDAGESEALAAARARFGVSVEEYTKAKAKAAEVMKWVAIAAIGAVATAMTGPGGATLTAAMITAGVQAGASVAIDELVLGNDYDASTEGLQKIVTDVAMAGIGHKLNTAWESAAQGEGLASEVVAGHKWLTRKEAALAAAIKEKGFPAEALWEVGKATAKVPLTGVKDAAVSSLDLSELKYGFLQGLTHANAVASKKLDAMPAEVRQAAIEAAIAQLGAKGKEAVGLGPDKRTAPLDVGTEDAPPPDKSLLERLGVAASSQLGPKAQLGAVWDQAVGVASTKAVDAAAGKAVGLDEADAWGFAEAYLKGRATGTAAALGKAAQDHETAGQVARRVAEFKAEIGSDPVLLKHYVHHLTTAGKNAEGGLGPSPTTFLTGEWQTVQQALAKQTAGDPQGEAAAAYRAWVLSDPAKTEGRLDTTLAAFGEGRAKSTDWLAKVRASSDYKALSPEGRAFYDSWAADPTRAFDFDKGAVDTTYDLSTAEGKKAFQDAVTVRKELIAAPLVPKVTEGWREDDKRQFGTWLRTTGLQGVALDPKDAAKNEAALGAAAKAWLDSATLTEDDIADLDPFFSPEA